MPHVAGVGSAGRAYCTAPGRQPVGSALDREPSVGRQAPQGGGCSSFIGCSAQLGALFETLACFFQWSTLSSSHGLSRFLNFLVGRLAGAATSSTSACGSRGESGIGGDGEAMGGVCALVVCQGRPHHGRVWRKMGG